MPTPELGTDELLTTTRAVRRRLDLRRAVDSNVLRQCLEIAIQAPTGSNAQAWQFVIVTDRDKRSRLAELYRRSFEAYRDMPGSLFERVRKSAEQGKKADTSGDQMTRVLESSEYLAEHLGKVPVHVIPCIQGRVDNLTGPLANRAQASFFGSILPAVWSFMLAARCRGLGTVWTTLHLAHEREAADLLGIPYEAVTQVALIPVAHALGGGFKRARRKSLDEMLHLDHW